MTHLSAMEATGKVRVAVRVRPVLDASTADDQCVSCHPDGRTLMIDLEQSSTALWPMRGAPVRSFAFDSVLGPETTQQQFFESSGVREMLDAALDGYTATIFAYGQTGSGKTYTVSGARAGSPESLIRDDAGLMQRCTAYLYAGMEERADLTFTVRATYLEIYNEQVVDLIEPGSGPLGVRGSSQGGFYVEDLSVTQCRDLRDLQYVMNKGLDNRHRRFHSLNSESSRVRFAPFDFFLMPACACPSHTHFLHKCFQTTACVPIRTSPTRSSRYILMLTARSRAVDLPGTAVCRCSTLRVRRTCGALTLRELVLRRRDP